MDARSIIAKLRRDQVPSSDELKWFAQGLADGGVSDAQAGAFAMAVCMGGLGAQGRADLTVAMRDSGDVLSWDFDGPVIDKHSTGGVGDSVSLVLAPALAELGAYVPMISGRGLGHTGGTLDKLESIPGVSTQIGQERLTQILRDTGAAIVGATGQIAPADKRLYAIRDVTATVESLDLITASILSKKLAASPQALVLDVKVGSGAFMKTLEDARKLAKALTETANAAGCRTSAVITDMHQPLAPALGNALEVAEVMNVLTHAHYDPLAEISAELGGVLLADAGMCSTAEDGREKVAAVIRDGRAAERFGRMMAAVGGPLQFVENWSRYLPEASVILEVAAPTNGYVASINGEALGLAVVALGGGRQVEDDVIDPAVGLSGIVRLGDKIDKGAPLAVVHAAREDAAQQAAETVRRAVTLSPDSGPIIPLVHERITA
ncbi:thymidine phosphorylase [Ruegeria meonggei]|uniref:Thymidine phosphorylase n=1 Tax=Ruegeria meonggei TaxID=1446476 RepID=A0A1X6YC64_9RHOB|nr:thymidine phosphorylase [Ruegeria meonggei]SLN16668.1 Thymidine phosphorylase [Ruegeria meonggei]